MYNSLEGLQFYDLAYSEGLLKLVMINFLKKLFRCHQYDNEFISPKCNNRFLQRIPSSISTGLFACLKPILTGLFANLKRLGGGGKMAPS